VDLKNLSIIVPLFNEESNISSVIDDFYTNGIFDKIGEIIFVDDGSVDNSFAVLNKNEIIKKKNVILIKHQENLGYGAALKTGIRHAKSEFIATFDSDQQHKIHELLKLTKGTEVDLVIGQRAFNQGAPLSRFLGRVVVVFFARILISVNLSDLSSGLRVWRRDLILKFEPYLPNGYSFSTTSLIIATVLRRKIVEVPIKVTHRPGKSGLKLSKGWYFLVLIFNLMLLFKPLRLFLITAIPQIFIATYYFLLSISSGENISIRSMVAGVGGISILMAGLVSHSIAQDRIRNLNNL
jgi:glycosyltransferase involved in cell wall biosynthesis